MNATAIAILELILKGSAVLIAGYGGAAVLARSSAAHRTLMWLGVFSVLLLLPLAMLVRPVWSVPLPAAWQTASEPATSRLPALPVAGVVPDTTAAQDTSERFHVSFHLWLAAIYGCGFVAVLVFRFIGAWQLRLLRRSAVVDGTAQSLVDEWRHSVGMRRRAPVFASSRATVPMTWGVLRPVILLPEDCRNWAPGELHAALQHEFAHVLHWDAARRWLGTIVTALWWPHPLAWTAARAWRLEQELACDDVVLNGGGNAAAYARQLVAVAGRLRLSQFSAAAALVMAIPAGLEARLRAVVNPRADRSPARRRSLMGCAALATLVLAANVAIRAQSIAAPPSEPASPAKVKPVEKQAQETIIPEIDIREATIKEALTVIATKAGIKIQYTEGRPSDARITLKLSKVPASEALKYVVDLANLKITYEVDHVWVDGRGPDGAGSAGGTATTYALGATNAAQAPVSNALSKAEQMVIPKIAFHDTSLVDAVDFLRKKTTELDPKKVGISIVLKPGFKPGARITMEMQNLPLSEALRYVASLAELKLRVEPDALILESEKTGR